MPSSPRSHYNTTPPSASRCHTTTAPPHLPITEPPQPSQPRHHLHLVLVVTVGSSSPVAATTAGANATTFIFGQPPH
ncbi:hypothetical protein Tco_1383848 [Tanacetum coccineum]